MQGRGPLCGEENLCSVRGPLRGGNTLCGYEALCAGRRPSAERGEHLFCE